MDCINETMAWPMGIFWSLGALMTIYTKYERSLTWFQALQVTGGFIRIKFTVKRAILHAAIVGIPMGLWLYLRDTVQSRRVLRDTERFWGLTHQTPFNAPCTAAK